MIRYCPENGTTFKKCRNASKRKKEKKKTVGMANRVSLPIVLLGLDLGWQSGHKMRVKVGAL